MRVGPVGQQNLLGTGYGLLYLLILLFGGFPVIAAEQSGKIQRALFTTAVIEGQPVNRVLVVDDTVETVHFFTELQGFKGQRISHRWEYNGRVMEKKTFRIESQTQAVASSRRIGQSQTGRWTVVIENQEGWPLHAEIFMYAGEAAATHGVVIMPLQ